MKRFVLVLAATVSMAVGVATVSTTAGASEHQRNFTAHLSGSEEEPAVETRATGQTVLSVDRDGSVLRYRLIVANIEDVAQAHIHVGAPGVNGPVVAFLYGPAPISGRTAGVLATGTITAADLIGPLTGASLDDLLDEIRSGNAYVNVHTADNPGGEIRGQIG